MKYISVRAFGKPELLRIMDGPEPVCDVDEVAIKVAYAGVGGIDAILRRGDLGDLNPLPPFTPGLEVSGEIISVGSDVTGFDVGDKVAALLLLRMGGYGEIICCPATGVVKLPEGVDLAAAASLVNPTTAVVALSMVQPQEGEVLVVHGATGGLGGVIGQVAQAIYPHLTTVGVVRNTGKTAHLTGYEQILTVESFTQSVKDGKRFPIIFDPVGGDLRRISLEALTPRGRMLVLGNVSGDTASLISSQSIWLNSLNIQGLNLGFLNSVDPHRVNVAAQQVVALLAGGKIDTAPSKMFPFSQAASAHEYLESGEAYGRVVLAV